jgi:adenosine kinase
MRIFVTGSIAYDYIMVFPGRFRDHILADKVHVLSVSFLVDSLVRRRGGTGANIAYNLGLMGEKPVLVGSAGDDFGDYRSWLENAGVDTSGVKIIAGEHTASCFINTDLQDNQITAFYPGAMAHAESVSLTALGAGSTDMAIVAPNDPTAMVGYVQECREAGIPYVYDPAMQLPRLEPDQLHAGCDGASLLAGNDYEFGMMADKMGISEGDLRRKVPVTVMTRGEAGALITAGSREYEIPVARPERVVDPTGAGDAYRSGIVLGLRHGLSWPIAGRVAALCSVYAIEQPGTQQHAYTLDAFIARYRENFGDSHELAKLIPKGAPRT